MKRQKDKGLIHPKRHLCRACYKAMRRYAHNDASLHLEQCVATPITMHRFVSYNASSKQSRRTEVSPFLQILSNARARMSVFFRIFAPNVFIITTRGKMIVYNTTYTMPVNDARDFVIWVTQSMMPQVEQSGLLSQPRLPGMEEWRTDAG